MASEKILTEWVDIAGGETPVRAHVAYKDSSAPLPAVIVLPTIHGANAYAEEVAGELAVAGYFALLIDIYAPGAAPDLSSPDNIKRAVQELDDTAVVASIQAAVNRLRAIPAVATSPIGVLGFCIGGTHALLAASHVPGVQAAVGFYGMLKYPGRTAKKPRAPMECIAELNAPVLYHVGDNDPWVNPETFAQYAEGLREHKKNHELCVYRGAGHAFHEHHKPGYRPVAARLAWANTLTFFGWYLKSQHCGASQ